MDSISLGLLQPILDVCCNALVFLCLLNLRAPCQVCHTQGGGERWLDTNDNVACSNWGKACICVLGTRSGSLLEGASMQIADYDGTGKAIITSKAAW